MSQGLASHSARQLHDGQRHLLAKLNRRHGIGAAAPIASIPLARRRALNWLRLIVSLTSDSDDRRNVIPSRVRSCGRRESPRLLPTIHRDANQHAAAGKKIAHMTTAQSMDSNRQRGSTGPIGRPITVSEVRHPPILLEKWRQTAGESAVGEGFVNGILELRICGTLVPHFAHPLLPTGATAC